MPWLSSDIRTWQDLLSTRASVEADREALLFCPDGEEVAARRTFADLDRRARAIAARLGALGKPGDRVLCLHRPGLDFVDALFGCFYAGMVAVPTYPPRIIRGALDRSGARVTVIAKSCAPSIVLTDRASAPAVTQALGSEIPIVIGEEIASDGESADPYRADEGTLAVLQYTSGSTSEPRGVMLSHGCLLENSRAIFTAFGHRHDSRGALWLPHEHDMGLIGAVLQPLYACGPTLLMPPLAFLQEPADWLRAISRHRATTAGGPNFAYDLCVDRTDDADLEGLDLSCWEVAFVGAEPVRAQTLEAFAKKFERAGFRASAFLPCYGLAESTLIVAGSPKGRGARTLEVSRDALSRGRAEPASGEGATVLVSVGVPVACDLFIVDPESGRPLEERSIGEIWVKSGSVALGYWGREQDPTFGAAIYRTEGSFLRTGDLGFIWDGELYVTGRAKDLIIVDGANHHPEDIERSIDGCHPELRAGSGAVFGIESRGGEGIVVVWETRRSRTKDDPNEVIRAIRAAVARDHQVPIVDVVLTQPARVPRTESGKIKRYECRRMYLAGELAVEDGR